MKTLSVCMITKNEEKNIGRCLKSIRHLADEIIVADTGSNDKTVEIAKSYGAKVINHPWKNDFSDARNASICDATCDWILFLDADEEMDVVACDKMKQLINMDTTYEGYYLRLVNIIENTDIGDSVVLRAFKNKPEYRFRGKMHEQIVTSIQEIHGLDCIGQTDIRILHYGYDPNVSDVEVKHKRNIDLLNSYDEKDKDGYYYYVLGNEYARVNNFEKANEIYQKALKVTDLKYKYIYYPYLILNIAKIHSNAKKFGQEIKFINDVRYTVPNFKDLYFLEAMAYIECCKFSKALQSIESFLVCPQGHSYEYPNNNFENCYNISELKQQLQNTIVPQGSDTISGLIVVDNYYEGLENELIDTIKSLNEISTSVVVAIDKDKGVDVEKIKSVCSQVVEVKQPEKKFSLGLKDCKGKFVVMLKPGDVCSFESQKEIVDLLSKSKKDAFNCIMFNMMSGNYKNEIRIIKNVKKIESLDDYIEKLRKENKQLASVPVYIHAKYN